MELYRVTFNIVIEPNYVNDTMDVELQALDELSKAYKKNDYDRFDVQIQEEEK